MPRAAPVMNTVRPLTSNGTWRVRLMGMSFRSGSARSAWRAARGVLTPASCVRGSGRGYGGDRRLRASVARARLVEAAVQVPANVEGPRAGAVEVGDAVHQVVQLGLDHEHDRVVPQA